MRNRYNLASGTLGAALGDDPVADTTITFDVNPDFSFGNPQPTVIKVDGELMYLIAYSGGATGTVVRGREGTLATAHDNGAVWEHVPTVADYPVVMKRRTSDPPSWAVIESHAAVTSNGNMTVGWAGKSKQMPGTWPLPPDYVPVLWGASYVYVMYFDEADNGTITFGHGTGLSPRLMPTFIDPVECRMLVYATVSMTMTVDAVEVTREAYSDTLTAGEWQWTPWFDANSSAEPGAYTVTVSGHSGSAEDKFAIARIEFRPRYAYSLDAYAAPTDLARCTVYDLTEFVFHETRYGGAWVGARKSADDSRGAYWSTSFSVADPPPPSLDGDPYELLTEITTSIDLISFDFPYAVVPDPDMATTLGRVFIGKGLYQVVYTIQYDSAEAGSALELELPGNLVKSFTGLELTGGTITGSEFFKSNGFTGTQPHPTVDSSLALYAYFTTTAPDVTNVSVVLKCYESQEALSSLITVVTGLVATPGSGQVAFTWNDTIPDGLKCVVDGVDNALTAGASGWTKTGLAAGPHTFYFTPDGTSPLAGYLYLPIYLVESAT